MKSSHEFSVLFSLVLVCLQLFTCLANISDFRKCADEQCKAQISTGRTTQRYDSRERGVLSFRVDDEVNIFSKEAGTNKNLWGVEIKGKRGYAPMKFIKEEKIIYKDDNLKFIVPTIPRPIAISEKNKPTETKLSESQSEHSATDSHIPNVVLSPSDAEYKDLKTIHGKISDNDEVIVSDSNLKINLQKDSVSDNREVKLDNVDSNMIKQDGNQNNEINEKLEDSKEAVDVDLNLRNNLQEDSNISDSGELKLHIDDPNIIKLNDNINKEMNVKPKDSSNDKVNVLHGLNTHSTVGSSHIVDESSVSMVLPDNKIQDKLSDGNNSNQNLKNESINIKDDELSSINNIDLIIKASNEDELINPKDMSNDKDKITDSKVEVADTIIYKVDSSLTSGSKLESKISDKAITEGTPNNHLVESELNNKAEEDLSLKESDTAAKETDTNKFLNLDSNDITDNNLVDVPKTSENEVNDNTLDDSDDEEMDNDGEEEMDDGEEELDNEDEGNGNEGEENGNEMDMKSTFDKFSSYNSKLNPSMETIIPSKPLEQTGNSVINYDKPSDSKSKFDNVPHPTPSPTYEVFEGTTFYMNEGESAGETESSTVSHHQSTQLYSSEEVSSSSTETPQLPNTLESISSIVEDVFDKTKQILSSVSLDINTVVVKDSSVLTSLVSNQIENLALEADDLSLEQSNEDFATPKPETIVDVLESTSPPKEDKNGESFISSFFYGTSEVEQDNSKTLETQTDHNPAEDAKNLNDILPTSDLHTSSEHSFKDASKPLEENLSVNSLTSTVSFQEAQEEITESPNIDSVLQEVEKDSINDLPFIDPYKDKDEELVIESGLPPSPEDVGVSISNMESLTTNLLKASRNLVPDSMALAIEEEFTHPHISFRTAVILIVVGVTITALYLLHLINVKYSRESPLLDAMNKLDKQHRFVLEENNNLKRKLSITSNGQIKSGGMSMSADPMEITLLKNELASTKFNLENELEQLKLQNQQLENDLETSTASEEELLRMMNELLSNQKETKNFEESVNILQTMLDNQREKVESLTSDLSHKTRLNDELRSELKTIKTRSAKLEYQIEQLTQSLDEMKTLRQDALKRLEEEESNVLSLREMNNSMRQEADVIRKQSEEQRTYSHGLEETVKDMRKQLNLTQAECQVSKECLKNLQLHCGDGSNNYMNKLSELFSIIEVKSKLEVCEKGRQEAEQKLKEKEEGHQMLRKQVEQLEMQSADVQKLLNEIETERDEAKSKLSVLTQYYEEKEAQLKRELESQEVRRHDAEGSAADISSSISNYKLELESCREQITCLKSEYEKQKQSFKMQLTNEEKKLNESWVAARAAERRQEELRQENTQLRQKLTQMQRDPDQSLIIKNSVKRGETNGSLPSPILLENEFDGIHSPPAPISLDFDGPLPPMPPPPHMMPPMSMFPPPPMSMFPRPPHLHPGLPPLPPGMPPPFMGHLPPPPHPDRRLPPAGRIASPPGYDRRSYSPGSDYSDHRYSPGPRYSPGGGNRGHSPDRRSDRSRQSNMNSRRKDRSSPDRWFTRSPQGFKRHSPHRYYNNEDNLDDKRTMANSGKKTSTPLGPNDR